MRQLDGVGVDHRDVADPHARAGVIAVARADVDVQVSDLRDLLALLLAQQMDRLLADDAGDLALTRAEHDALADEDLRVPAAYGGEPQVALIVDVCDDQSDLVDVAHHEQPPRRRARAMLGSDERQRRADDVGRDPGEALRRVAPDRRRGGLIARGAVRVEQVAQDLRGGGDLGLGGLDLAGRGGFARGGARARSGRGA